MSKIASQDILYIHALSVTELKRYLRPSSFFYLHHIRKVFGLKTIQEHTETAFKNTSF